MAGCLPTLKKSWLTFFFGALHSRGHAGRPLVAVLDFSPKLKTLSTQITLSVLRLLPRRALGDGEREMCGALFEWI